MSVDQVKIVRFKIRSIRPIPSLGPKGELLMSEDRGIDRMTSKALVSGRRSGPRWAWRKEVG